MIIPMSNRQLRMIDTDITAYGFGNRKIKWRFFYRCDLSGGNHFLVYR